MDRDIFVVLGIWDEKYETKHTFNVKLGEKAPKGVDDNDYLTQKMEEAFNECKRKNRLFMIFDGSNEDSYEVEEYVSPFEIGKHNPDFREINQELINIAYYSKKKDKLFNKLQKEELDFYEMLEKVSNNKN